MINNSPPQRKKIIDEKKRRCKHKKLPSSSNMCKQQHQHHICQHYTHKHQAMHKQKTPPTSQQLHREYTPSHIHQKTYRPPHSVPPPHKQISKLTRDTYNALKSKFPNAVGLFQKTVPKGLYKNLVETPTQKTRGHSCHTTVASRALL